MRHAVSQFTFSLLYLSGGATVKDGNEGIKKQIEFVPLIRKRSWLRKDDVYTFVDPGVVQKYRYVTHLPGDAAFALLHSKFKYPNAASEFHSAQRVFNVISDPKAPEHELNELGIKQSRSTDL